MPPEKSEYHNSIPERIFRRSAVGIFKLGFRVLHNTTKDTENLPKDKPAIFYFNHASAYDIPFLMGIDPYSPPTVFPAKAEMYKIPIYGNLLRSWGSMSVDRGGGDLAALRTMKRLVLTDKRTMIIAVEGTRSPDGHLQPFDKVAVEFILRIIQDGALKFERGVPVHPAAIIGAYEVLPKGAKFPRLLSRDEIGSLRRNQIKFVVGERVPLVVPSSKKFSEEDTNLAALQMREALVKLLPPNYHPLTDQLVWEKKV